MKKILYFLVFLSLFLTGCSNNSNIIDNITTDESGTNEEVKSNLNIAVIYFSATNNTANVAVYLPRTFSIYSLILFAFIGIIFIAFIFYNHDVPIQEIVSKKKDMTNTRSTSIINLSFAFIIFVFGQINHIPMATTWVFIGILAGRELCIAQLENDGVLTLKERCKHARKLIFKDFIINFMKNRINCHQIAIDLR